MNKTVSHCVAGVLTGCLLPMPMGHASAVPAVPAKINMLQQLEGTFGSIAFDYGYAYLSTSKHVYRAARELGAGFTTTPLALGNCAVEQESSLGPRPPKLYTQDNTLYLVNPQVLDHEGEPQEHAVCKSSDHGGSFQPMDNGLAECIGSSCKHLTGNQLLPQHRRIYFNAGGGVNLAVSQDQGQTWSFMLGSPAQQACYDQEFAIVDRKLLVGGECPLDFACIRAYPLDVTLTALQSQNPLPVGLPPLENRKINFIQHMPGTRYVFAGVEGGVLRSSDAGANFAFRLKYTDGGGSAKFRKYPYMRHIVFCSARPGSMYAGGYDNVRNMPYLAYSSDYGKTWKDVTRKLARIAPGPSGDALQALVETPDGRILAGVTVSGNSYIAELPVGGM